MIFPADMIIAFAGPHRAARAAELLAQLPMGAAETSGAGGVRLLRSVAVTFTPVLPARAARPSFLHRE